METEKKKSEQKDSKPIVPRDRDEAMRMLCAAAEKGNVDEVSQLATWKYPSRFDRAFTPSIVNGRTWERSPLDKQNAESADLTNTNFNWYQRDKHVYYHPLLAVLEAPNAKTFLKLMSFKPQYFINKYPFQLIRAIIWWPLWPQEEKLKALKAVWDVLLPEQLKLLKGKNGAPLRKEDLPDLLKNLIAKPAAPKNNHEIMEKLCRAAEKGDAKEIDKCLMGTSSNDLPGNPNLSYNPFSEKFPLFLAIEAPDSNAFNALLDAKSLQSFNKDFLAKEGAMLARKIALLCRWLLAEKLTALGRLAEKGIHLKPIYLAALKGDVRSYSTQQLIEKDSADDTAIYYAGANNHLSVLQTLKALPDLFTILQTSFLARENQQEKIIEWCLNKVSEHLHNPQGQGRFELFSLLSASNAPYSLSQLVTKGYLESGKWLFERQKQPNSPLFQGIKDFRCEALLAAATHGHLKIVRWLVDKEKATLANVEDVTIRQALQQVISQEHLNSLQYLLDAGANIKNISEDNEGILELAIRNNSAASIALILRLRPEEFSKRCSDGNTPLIRAVNLGKLEAVEALLHHDHGASIEETDDRGNTALLIACSERNVAMMRLLFENGASVVAKNNRGETALVLAARPMLGDHTALRRTATYFLITEAGADPGDGFDLVGYLVRDRYPSLTKWCAEFPNILSPEELAALRERATQIKALYDGYLAKQQARIDEALGEESSPLIGVKDLRLIIGGYAALHPDGDLEPIPKTPHSQSRWKDTQPTMVNLSEEQQNGEKEFKSIGDAAKFFNKSGFQGTSGWSVTGEEEISATFDNVLTLEQAKKQLKDDHPHAIFRETETNITTTSSSLDTSYYLHAKVRVSQASDVMQSHSSASANGVPNLHANTAGFTHPRNLPATDLPANNPVSSSSSTSNATQEQQPVAQNGSGPVKR